MNTARRTMGAETTDEVCGQILRNVGHGLLWTDANGPADALYDLEAGRVSPYQRVAARTALAIHEGRIPPEAARWIGLL